MYFAADHLIEKSHILNRSIHKNKSNLDDQNIYSYLVLNLQTHQVNMVIF